MSINMQQGGEMGFDIEISGDINAIQGDWELLEREGVSTPFQRRAWLLPLYEKLAPLNRATPVFVLIRDQLSRKPLMLLPLCTSRRHGAAVIEFADFGVSDYNAPVISRAFNPSSGQWQKLWHSVTRALKKNSVLSLKKMPEFIEGHPNPLVQYGKGSKPMEFSWWGVALPATHAEFNKQVLSSTFSKELAKKFRRTAKRGEIHYSVAETVEEKRMVFNILAQQRQARFDEMGRNNILAQPVYRQFYEAVAVESPEMLARIGMLKVGGEIVGCILTLNHQKAVHVLMSTFQGGEWKSCSLGNVVIQSAIEHSINNGATFFDLTIGNESYKQDFGAKPNGLYSVLQPLTPAGSPVAIIMIAYAVLKKIVKRWLPNADKQNLVQSTLSA